MSDVGCGERSLGDVVIAGGTVTARTRCWNSGCQGGNTQFLSTPNLPSPPLILSQKHSSLVTAYWSMGISFWGQRTGREAGEHLGRNKE